MKFEGGLFENPYADEKTADAKTATPDAIALAREAARKAVVLLKNDKGVLPLDPGEVQAPGPAGHPRQGHADRRLQRRAAPRGVDP
jgi:beta-glucosidase-like glycosyl hydrolase